jgi:hypothetical protein
MFPRIRAMFNLFVAILAFSELSHAAQSDTVVVQSIGYGRSTNEAIKDAIRKAAEQSLGMHLSSSTIIQNYMTVRDVISTSTNAYVYKYETVTTEFDKSTSLYKVSIEALITRRLLVNAVNAKMATETIIDMTEIEKAKFEMKQAKERAKSAVAYYASFVQNNFRDYVKFRFDSLSIIEKDVVSMVAKIRVNNSLLLIDDAVQFLSKAVELNGRAFEYSKRKYASTFDVVFSLRNNTNEKYLRNDIQEHSYKFTISLRSLPKDSINIICKSGYFTEHFFKSDSLNKSLFTYDITRKPCQLSNDTLRIPIIDFNANSSGFGSSFAFPLESLRSSYSNQYSNSFIVEMPIDSIKPDLLTIRYSVNTGEYVTQSDGSLSLSRTFTIVNKNSDKDIVELFREY